MFDKSIYFQNVCKETAKLSTCASKQVGVVLVKNNRILAASYNGTPAGCEHCLDKFDGVFEREVHHEWSLINELHAEENLIGYCAKYNICTDGCEIYTTVSPCNSCAKLLCAAGIKKIFYKEIYDYGNGLDILKKFGIEANSW